MYKGPASNFELPEIKIIIKKTTLTGFFADFMAVPFLLSDYKRNSLHSPQDSQFSADQ
jgi:hypothetical protein